MSCNGCRILRKGCSDACVLRESIEWIDGADAQANATVFVAKFIGRSTLLAFLSSVPSPLRPHAFRSLLYEACGRTASPVNGAAGLLWTGNWQLCQAAVDTVLAGGAVHPVQELAAAEVEELYRYQKTPPPPRKRRKQSSPSSLSSAGDLPAFGLDLCQMPISPDHEENWQASTPSESSVTTTTTSTTGSGEEPTLLTLFV